MRMFIVLCLSLAALTGCKNDCDKASDRITAKYEECGYDVSDTGAEEEVECDEDKGAYYSCLADCVEAADCAALTGEDLDAAMDYATCVGGC